MPKRKKTAKLYHYKTSGLPNIWLKGGVVHGDSPYGPTTAIEDLDELHRVISYGLVRQPRPLTGREARFLRIELDLSQKRLGILLNTGEQTVARWEKGRTGNVRALDRALRMLWLAWVKDRKIAETIERIADRDGETAYKADKRIVLTREGGERWDFQRAA